MVLSIIVWFYLLIQWSVMGGNLSTVSCNCYSHPRYQVAHVTSVVILQAIKVTSCGLPDGMRNSSVDLP